jgi:hypothetical protein
MPLVDKSDFSLIFDLIVGFNKLTLSLLCGLNLTVVSIYLILEFIRIGYDKVPVTA